MAPAVAAKAPAMAPETLREKQPPRMPPSRVPDPPAVVPGKAVLPQAEAVHVRWLPAAE